MYVRIHWVGCIKKLEFTSCITSRVSRINLAVDNVKWHALQTSQRQQIERAAAGNKSGARYPHTRRVLQVHFTGQSEGSANYFNA